MSDVYSRIMRVTVIASVRASTFEEAELKLDAVAVSRAVRPPANIVEDVSLRWHGTRFDRVALCTEKECSVNAALQDFSQLLADADEEIDKDESNGKTTLQ